MTPPPSPPNRTVNNDPLVLSLVRWLLIVVFVVIGWWVVSELAAILAPILAALGIAYLLDPVVEKLVARGMSRAMAATLILVAFLGTVVGMLTLLIPQAVEQVRVFAADLPGMVSNVSAWVKARFDFDLQSHLNAEELQAMLSDAAGPLEHIAEVALGGAFAVLAVLAEFLLVPVFAYYFLLDWPHIAERVIKIVPPRRRSRVRDILGEIDGVVSGWVRGQAIVTSILAILYALTFWIIGVPLAIPIGLLVGALTIIPFVGTFVGAGITALVLLLDWQGGGMLGAVGGTFLVLHLLEAAVLTPKIVGHKVGLSESAALFAVVAGGKLLGFVGILLAVPLAATVAVLLRHAVRYYEKSEFFGDEADAEVPVTPAMQVVMMGASAAGAAADPADPADPADSAET
ncbi:MAG: AI-2E family transporter [Myxococcales bacterium]|nr:AI-2E family transporter [Myxococcales bacterium]